ncbi:MAG: hypothetical protein KBC87_03580 [Candidatus Pacebacteria bacterium]|nr:hypothetical protein [Candidatus Paceibacterota bacterium]
MVVNLLSSEDNLTKPHPPKADPLLGGFSFISISYSNSPTLSQSGSEKRKRSP